MGSSLFWGIILIIVGLSLIIKVLFNIDFPIAKILFAFFFIYLGIKILIGNYNFHFINTGPKDVAFGERNFIYEPHNPLPKEQNILFGKGTIDFRNISISSLPAEIEINTIFGNCELLISKSIPVKIIIDVAFAGASLPDGNSTAFGTNTYRTPAFDENKPCLTIKADAVFGNLRIKAD